MRFLVVATVLCVVSIDIGNVYGQSEGVRRQAGFWQQTQTLLAFNTPQAAASINAAANASIGRPIISERVCVSPVDVARDTLASRLNIVTPMTEGFRWSNLQVLNSLVTAIGRDRRGEIAIEGKITPTLTELVATSTIIDPTIGPARRVQRTVLVRLGPC